MFSRTRCRWAPPAIEDVVAAFKVLGLTFNPRATTTNRPGVDDVRRQYREMARLHHPDLSSGDDNRMKVINTAYELIQSSGVLQGAYDTSAEAPQGKPVAGTRFARKAGTRRRRVPDDFANGDDSSWSMKTSLDWQSMMNSSDSVSEEEMKNPANHPFSHSKFFTFEDDLSIYRMIRGGATVPQVARTLGKPATFIERRLQNAQFKLRVQYVLRQDKRKTNATASSSTAGGKPAAGTSSTTRYTTSTPITEPTTRRALRRSPYECDAGHADFAVPSSASVSGTAFTPPQRKREWEATYPEWRAPRYRDQMTLEEQGRLDGLLRETPEPHAKVRGAADHVRHGAVSKMGRSYENYQRMRSNRSR